MMKQILLILLFSFVLLGCASEINDAPAELSVSAALPVEDTVMQEPTATPMPEVEPTEIAPPEPTALPPESPVVEEKPTAEEKPVVEETAVSLPGVEVFTFAVGEPEWYTVDDDVMGGVSSSTVAVTEDSTLFFSGTMSLDNNGGFSSVRSNYELMDLSGADGILMRVLGDGKTYRLRIRSVEVGPEISYNGLFGTRADDWTVVYVPFADMVPTYRGFVMDVGPLDAATIGSFGIMLSDKQPGEFGLVVDWMRAVSEDDLRSFVGEGVWVTF
jgi:NADH dehydrogenase [ubiquinone] 1 alpha subcomplex assembly factor 1